MEVGWIHHEAYLRHQTGPDHPERVERLRAVLEAMDDSGLSRRLVPVSVVPAQRSQLETIHEAAYIDVVKIACEEGVRYVGTRDTHICEDSYEAGLLAAGGVLAACDAVMGRSIRRAFCPVRPPGHHAERDLAMGFCLFNNIAIAAEHLLREHGLARIAIVDFDVHHGNGTQHAFEDRDEVMVVSIHEHPHFLFPHTGYEYETGNRKGSGYTINVPMLPGEGDEEYRKAFDERILPRVEAFDPQFVLVSTGFDAVREDPLADINLDVESYRWITDKLVGLAEHCCEGRLVSVLEGGYDLDAIRRSTIIHVESLMGMGSR